jgi:HPt (histidine-containing phosphotransfer) domain-containing protein
MTMHENDRHMAPSIAMAEAFNLAEALERVEGDLDLLKEMVDLFLEEVPNMVAAIEQALIAGDPSALQHAAHTLKGSVSNFAAPAATEASFVLEKIGRQHNLALAPTAFTTLKWEIARLLPALTALQQQEII